MSKTNTLFMETTEVPAEKTASEIWAVLVKAGASRIMVDYEAGKMSGFSFAIPVGDFPVPFKLPVRVEPVFKSINGRRPENNYERYGSGQMANKDRAQAERVAWRQLLRWVQAQVAMIDTGMVAPHEVFMPYVLNDQGRTMFEVFQESGLKMLAARESK